MSIGIVTAASQPTFHNYAKPNFIHSKAFLDPCSHLRFDTHLQKQRTPRSTRSSPIKAAVSNLYVSTENFYDLLGISDSGTLKDIKHAYKQLARKYHPDVSPPDRTEEYTRKFIQVQEAYETLSDPSSRALYDRDMVKRMHLSFFARSPSHYHEGWFGGYEWKQHWQSQLVELQRKSTNGTSRGKMSWGARMRAQARKATERAY